MVALQGKIVEEQFFGHYGMPEIYVHYMAGLLLFFVSIAAVVVIKRTLKDTGFHIPGLMLGIITTGFIGLGEVFEHFYKDPFIVGFFHYLHLISGLAALLFFYYGIKEFAQQCSYGKAEFISSEVQIGVTAGVLTIPFLLSSVITTPVASAVELGFIIIILLPILLFSFLIVKEALNMRKAMIVLYPLAAAMQVAIINFVILFGRIADIKNIAWLYIVTHAFQDVLLSGLTAIVMFFTFGIIHAKHINALHAEPMEKPPELTQEKQKREIY